MIFLIKVIVVVSSLLVFSLAKADDSKNLPVELDQAFLQLSAAVAEVSQGNFIEPQYKLGFKSDFSKQLDLKLSFGATQILYKPNWIASSSERVSLIDAIATYRTSILDFYAGQFLIPWGLEGKRDENDLFFSRTLLYERGYFLLRDYGVGVKAQNQGFAFDLCVHSGEGGGVLSADNKTFFTGRWTYETPLQTAIGLSATEGRFVNASTLVETKIRGANLFFKFNFVNLKVELEASGFQSVVNGGQTDWLAWHGDFIYHVSDEINILGRYEQYNPNLRQVQNVLGRGTVSVEWHNKDSASRLFFTYMKNNESLNETPNDEFRITWRIATL